MNKPIQIVPGITVDVAGQASVDSSMQGVLFDLALNLEEPTDLPVDMQHVVAALILAGRDGVIDAQESVSATDTDLVATLVPYIKSVFDVYGERLGSDD